MIIKLELIGLFRNSNVHRGLASDIQKAAIDMSLIKFNGLDFFVEECTECLSPEPDSRYHDYGILGNSNGAMMLTKSRRYIVTATLRLAE